MPVVQQLAPDAFFRAAAKEHSVRQDDRHHAVVLQVVQPVQQEGEVGRVLGRHSDEAREPTAEQAQQADLLVEFQAIVDATA